MDVLSFLVSVADKVFQWFGDEYDQLYQGAKNAWQWIQDAAFNTLDQAQRYADNYAKEFISLIQSTFTYVYQIWYDIQLALSNQLNNWLTGLYSLLGSWFQQFETFIGQIWTELEPYVDAAIQGVKDWVNSNIISLVNGVLSAYDWVLSLKDQILNLINSLANIDWGSILAFIQGMITQIGTFLSDPLGFIFDLIWSEFVTFFCWVMAQALGTTHTVQNNVPPWKTGMGDTDWSNKVNNG